MLNRDKQSHSERRRWVKGDSLACSMSHFPPPPRPLPPTPSPIPDDPDFLNLSKKVSDYIAVSGEFGDLGKESKREQYNLWMTDHPAFTLKTHITGFIPYSMLSLQQGSESYRLQKIDHDKQTNTYMLQTIYRSTTHSIKRLDTNNPNIHPWEPDWITHIYSHNRVLCSYKKKNEKYLITL